MKLGRPPAIVIVLAVLVAGRGLGLAQGQAPTGSLTSVNVSEDAGHNLTLKISGQVPSGTLYLGRSFYPATYNPDDAATVSDNLVEQVGPGTFSKSYKVPAKFVGGGYEVALWNTKVPITQCRYGPCKWCKALGYHMDGMAKNATGTTGYVSGELVAKDATTLTVVVVKGPSGQATSLKVVGDLDLGPGFIGYSYYPSSWSDVVRDGTHRFVQVPAKGKFTYTWPIEPGFVGGAYSVAVWRKKVEAAHCTLHDCAWCKKNGYHLARLVTFRVGTL